jgi:hypothetical protein
MAWTIYLDYEEIWVETKQLGSYSVLKASTRDGNDLDDLC